ncbi:hypothetical protein BB559_002661 [Furculomyces boomerangus]|uniref:Coatomer subunit zeta n=3 Tax=Harpellales TaxID=61421 RepID=A0A2T9YTE8_9FUNG|nr:hypothetical protein BB559_002661 [Furculomyces boomerangus]
MMTNLSLYTVNAVIIFDNEGKRLISKYYNRQQGGRRYITTKEKRAFEGSLQDKVKSGEEIMLFDGNLIIFSSVSDVTFCLVGSQDENELLLMSILNGFIDSLNMLLRQNVDKRSILDGLDLVLLALDETIDDGIALETDPEIITSRVSRRGEDSVDMNLATLNEKTLLEAYKQAKERFNLSLR